MKQENNNALERGFNVEIITLAQFHEIVDKTSIYNKENITKWDSFHSM